MIDPIRAYFLKTTPGDAGSDCSSACIAPAREQPVLLGQLAEENALESKGPRANTSPCIHRAIAVEYEYHEPAILRIVALPSPIVTRCLHLNAFSSVLEGIAREFTFREHIGMPIVVLVLRQRTPVVRVGGRHN